MNQFYSLKFGLEASSIQAEVMQAIKSAGDDVIQTSDGLCLKTSRAEDELRRTLKEAGFESGLKIEKLEEQGLKDASPNVRAFAGLN